MDGPEQYPRTDVQVIVVTRLNGPPFAVNPDLVQRIDSAPDTILTLVDGTKYIVQESMYEVIELVNEHRSRMIARAQDIQRESAESARTDGRAYLARRGTPHTPDDLRQHDCLAFAYPATDNWRDTDKLWRMTGEEGEVEVPVAGSLTINSSQGLRQAAVNGMGIIMLADALVQPDLESGKLVALLTTYQLSSRPMHLLYRQDRYRLPKLRAFVDFAMEKWAL